MNNEVRKPPRDFLDVEFEKFTETYMLDWHFAVAPEGKGEFHMALGEHEVKQVIQKLREILPGDDSLRVSQVLTADLQMILSHVNPLNMSLADETTYWQLKERIERESKGE